MTANQTKNISYSQTEEVHNSIKYRAIEYLDRCDTVADFTRRSIRDNAEDIHDFAKGGREANKLVRRLSRIRGIEEEQAQGKAPSQVVEGEFSRSLSVDVSLEQVGKLSDIQDETNLDRSQTVQYCQFRSLAQIADSSDIFDAGVEREMIQAWAELKGSLIDPQLNLHYVLTKRFVHQKPTTIYFIENDKRAFEEFAEVYRDEFDQTDIYASLVELFGEHSLTTTENIIEEHSDISLESERETGFLEEHRDDLE